MRLNFLAVFVAALSVVALQGPGALASGTTVETVKKGSILWVDATVSDPTADSVTVKIFSPRDENGRRHLWQRCDFGVTATGNYLCGIDISEKDDTAGRWVARAIVDTALADSVWFTP